ncbi:unnamed protein product [Protopolystoma xenopodis]|uniref:Innexin n=1 Tax=Protopolystoma xenopodis TaxID=117903 RepID=A0A448XKY0_9PLAT|nr:unnamed protein product [Protopolystoma xenopodis]
MVGMDFIGLFDSIQTPNRVSIEDFADRVNIFTVILLLLSSVVVAGKQYLLNSISCYIPVKPTGENFDNYLSDYCWVHGTIPLMSDEQIPKTPEQWQLYDETRRISELVGLSAFALRWDN